MIMGGGGKPGIILAQTVFAFVRTELVRDRVGPPVLMHDSNVRTHFVICYLVSLFCQILLKLIDYDT